MYSYDDIISSYIKHVNNCFKEKDKTFELFYKKAPQNQVMPYGVVKNINDSNSRSGRQLSFDVFIWSDDSTKISDIEESTKELVSISDSLLLKDVGATVYVDAIRDADDPDYRLVKKLISITINYF